MATKDPKPTEHESSAEEDAVKSSKKRKSPAVKEIEVNLDLPEPPSKRARRALKKGKTLPAKPQSSDDEAEGNCEQKSGEGKAASKKKERSPYGVWIGNLRFNVTRGELRKWLVDNSGGAITDDSITRVHMPTNKLAAAAPKTKALAENRGFAYVDFATFEANVAAIALSETELGGRKLLIKDSKNFDGRPKKEVTDEGADGDVEGAPAAAEQAKKSLNTKVFVGNLSFQVTEEDLREHFEKCGKIRWIKVATFEDSGKCKGYGWVNFEEPEAAAWAVKGFVKIRETIESLEDFMDEGVESAEKAKNADVEDKDNAEDEESKNGVTGKKKNKESGTPARIKTRKWWVNQLFGRPLKIELAEDDQIRYNKRFRGKGQQRQQNGDSAPGDRATATGGDAEGGNAAWSGERRERAKEKKGISYGYANDLTVARLTGAPVAHQGKKTTFE